MQKMKSQETQTRPSLLAQFIELSERRSEQDWETAMLTDIKHGLQEECEGLGLGRVSCGG
jgi:hypothetical protein